MTRENTEFKEQESWKAPTLKKHKRGRKADKKECKGVDQSSERSRRKLREHRIMSQSKKILQKELDYNAGR